MRAIRNAALAIVAMILTAQAAAAESCNTVGARCGAMVKTGCLARLGAGAEKIQQETCAAQFEEYRGCLAQAARRCAPGGGGGDTVLTSVTDKLCAVGVWKGPIIEPGFDSYTLRLEIGMRNGAPFARARYPELKCSSRGDVLEGPKNRRILFRETILDNRARCADGRYAVTCMADGRLHWRWFRNNGEYFDAILTR